MAPGPGEPNHNEAQQANRQDGPQGHHRHEGSAWKHSKQIMVPKQKTRETHVFPSKYLYISGNIVKYVGVMEYLVWMV